MRNGWLLLAGALLLCGCAGHTIEYLQAEYGGQEPSGYVDLGDPAKDENLIFNVWLHRTKPIINVQTNLRQAGTTGFVQGMTYGAVDISPPQPYFERAALRFFEESGRQNCQLGKATKLANIVYEFEYSCGLSAAALPPAAKGKAGKR